jgi:DNA-binding response OmpR family regulator
MELDMTNLSYLSKLKILYIEDDEETRFYTLEMFKNFFSNITIGVNGQDGLDKFKKFTYDAIFTDINMPIMDGLEMIKNIRLLNSNVPIFIFSAHDEVEYFIKSIYYGIDGYLLKPFSMQELRNIINKLADKKQTIPQNNSNNIRKLIDGFYWDKTTQTLYQYEKKIDLTKNEIELFNLFTSLESRIYSAEDIEIVIFDDDISDTFRVRNLLSRLKKKLQHDLIESIYGHGYRLR